MPRHQSLRKELKLPLIQLKKHKHVKKVTIGRYENCRHKFTPGTLKAISIVPNGIRLRGWDGSGVQEFTVQMKEPPGISKGPPAPPNVNLPANVSELLHYITSISK